MLVIHVDIRVLPDSLPQFLLATERNASSSLTEPGVLRFDVIQDNADPTHVVLVEVYRDAAAHAAHRQTPHYATWRDVVAEMMAVPRSSVQYSPVFRTGDDQWRSVSP
jgi:(4S)-4-hydroxy-5-phosphonooxypentane-2,3-dione isomerase